MTRKNYQAFADIIADEYRFTADEKSRLAIRRLARRMCNVFRADNGRFDSERFLAACKLGE